jgi:hypothetical protein
MLRLHRVKAKSAVRELRKLLLELQEKRFHEPDSDAREYCAWCRRSPHNVPPHNENCMVPRIRELLARTEKVEQ